MNQSKKLASPEQITGEVLSTAEPARIQALRIVSMLGAFAASFGFINFAGVASILPPDVAVWVTFAGGLLVGSKQGLLVLGDWLDNGKRDNSFQLPTILLPFLLVGLFSALTVSCSTSSFRFTPDGCGMVDFEKDGKKYSAGSCFDAEGKIAIYRVEWIDEAGRFFQADRLTNGGEFIVRYRETPDSLWVIWEEESGIRIDPPPSFVDIDATK